MEEATDVAVSHPFCSSVISFCTGEVRGKSQRAKKELEGITVKCTEGIVNFHGTLI